VETFVFVGAGGARSVATRWLRAETEASIFSFVDGAAEAGVYWTTLAELLILLLTDITAVVKLGFN
jgi:hypothetical protein